jgi:hypothetical protein
MTERKNWARVTCDGLARGTNSQPGARGLAESSPSGGGLNGWTKSSFSSIGDCVEWRIEDTGVQVRDSKDPSGPVLTFTHSEWTAFRRGMQAGEGAL